MKKLLVVFSLLLSVSAFAQKADSAKKEIKITPSSRYGSASPLVIVDGVKYNGDISAIPPNEIKSIDVLKSASATSSYGAEGVNGVILITTKKAKTAGLKPSVTITGTADSTSAPLYIIDGDTSTSKAFRSLNPGDIDNISVLKDASANSTYGPAGKNGVVIIVTKAYKKQHEAKKAEAEKQGKRD
jgi:TonB-dependent SusC/RagA subfamily outer membrane receptor